MVNFLKNSETITTDEEEQSEGVVPQNINCNYNNDGVFINKIISDEIELRDKNMITTIRTTGELNKAFGINFYI